MGRLKPCITCGTLTPNPRCPTHTRRNGSTRQWRTTRQHILDRDRHTCRYCGDPATTVDHILPLNRGGTDHPANLAAACQTCNTTKGTR